MTATPERRVAARILVELETRGGKADTLLHRQTEGMLPRERALTVALVQGVERHRNRYDFLLSPHCRRPAESLEPEVKVALRLSLCQLLDLDRIPVHAVLHQAGEVCRDLDAGRAVSFVSGVLRAFSREPHRVTLPTRGREALIINESLPPWLADALIAEMGFAEALEAAQAFNRAAALTLRIHTPNVEEGKALRALGEVGVLTEPGRWSPQAVRLQNAGDPVRLPGWEEGWWTVQDEAAQVVGDLVDAMPGQRILDLCAAPGGKSFQLAAKVGKAGGVVAADEDVTRLNRVHETARRLGDTTVQTVVHDARRPFSGSAFDAVLLDAPCSGLGVLRRHPEAKWQRSLADIRRKAILQGEMIQAAARAVKEGGCLVYAVCSPLRAEGEDVVARFLQSHPRWRQEVAGPEAMQNPRGGVRTWPHRHDTDAFFACRLRAPLPPC